MKLALRKYVAALEIYPIIVENAFEMTAHTFHRFGPNFQCVDAICVDENVSVYPWQGTQMAKMHLVTPRMSSHLRQQLQRILYMG